jgi:UDP-2,3-diacylglucosamine hydrolase
VKPASGGQCPVSGAPIGLIAGSGRLPVLFAEAARQSGLSVIVVAHEGETEAGFPAQAWVKLGQLGKIAEVLKAAGVSEAVFCGALAKPRLLDMRPDWLGLKAMARMRSFGDDAALRAIAQVLEEEGVRIVSPMPFVPGLLAPLGALGKRQLSDEQRKDAQLGLSVARAIGALDVGQTVAVKKGVVLAVEAAEGTDACIARAGSIAAGAVVVKVRKPQQDDRFDAPAVGPKTIEVCVQARCAALAVEAGATLILDRAAFALAADRAGLAVEGI